MAIFRTPKTIVNSAHLSALRAAVVNLQPQRLREHRANLRSKSFDPAPCPHPETGMKVV